MTRLLEQRDQVGVQSLEAGSRFRMVVAAAALVLVGAVAPASAAAATPETVTCGESITHSIVVANDLSCGFQKPVLTVGADHITIDLNGHTISGNWVPPLSSTGHSYVTIENGNLQNNATALPLAGDNHDTVSNVKALGGGEGPGIDLNNGSDNTVVDSTLSGDPGNCCALLLNHENNDVINGNKTLANKSIQIGGTGNQVTSNVTGTVEVSGSGDLIKANVIAPSPTAIQPGLLVEGDNNNVVDNSVSAQTLSGIVTQFPEGINVTGSGNMLSGNTADSNTGDGIHVLSAGNTLTSNVANNNGAYGIEAVSGVIDGGQNRASGNGNPEQCLNVVCSAPPTPSPGAHVVTPVPAAAAPPAPRITGHPAGVSTGLSATFAFTDGQAGVRFKCRLDGGTFSTCGSPRRYDALLLGSHTFQVQAVDSLGRVSGAASYRWTVNGTVNGTFRVAVKGKYVMGFGNMQAWAWAAVIDRFYGARGATKLTAFRVAHCAKQRSGRFRCGVSWRRAQYAFAGTATIGSLNPGTGQFKFGFSLVRRNIRTGARKHLNLAY